MKEYLEIIIFDNLSPIVDKPDRYNPRINKTFLEYTQVRGFIVDPTNPSHPRGKPIIENNVGYVKKNFFAGETFISREDCQERAIDWCGNVAGVRIHGTTRQRPIEIFEREEKGSLTHMMGLDMTLPTMLPLLSIQIIIYHLKSPYIAFLQNI